MEARTQFVRLVPDEVVNTCFGERAEHDCPARYFVLFWVGNFGNIPIYP
jgi:hypothetical protein